MKMGPRDSYLCLIPKPLDLPPPVSDDHQPDVTPAQSWALLQPLAGTCLYVGPCPHLTYLLGNLTQASTAKAGSPILIATTSKSDSSESCRPPNTNRAVTSPRRTQTCAFRLLPFRKSAQHLSDGIIYPGAGPSYPRTRRGPHTGSAKRLGSEPRTCARRGLALSRPALGRWHHLRQDRKEARSRSAGACSIPPFPPPFDTRNE